MLNRLIAKIIAILPQDIVWIFSKRYIAGKELKDAVSIAKQLNSKRIKTTIDVLGEYVEKTHEAVEYKQNYLQVIDVVKNEQLNTTLSVKPSMFGLLIDEDFCYLQVREVINMAKHANLSVCMDMEDSTCTQIELNLFEKLYTEFPNTLTIVLQAYLHRTLDDLKWLKSIMLAEHPINVRLCKGIYVEPQNIAFKQYNQINKNYLACADYMLENKFFSALATHDKHLISALCQKLNQKQIPKSNYEFQMLLGVRPKLCESLVNQNHPMRVYVPFGKHWYGYSTRRLKENPEMISHILKALVLRG